MIVEARFYSNTYPTDRGKQAIRLAGEFGFKLREQMNYQERGSVMTHMVFEASEPEPMCVEWFTDGLRAYDINPEVQT